MKILKIPILENCIIFICLLGMALNISILQWNCRGINNKIDDLLNSFKTIPDILVLQETNLIKNKYFSIKGYETILRFGERKDKKQGNGKGLIIAIKDNHTGWVKQKIDNESAQLLTAEIYINNKIKISVTNIYRKTKKYTKEEGQIFWNLIDKTKKDHFILGDFNAHNNLWGDTINDNVGITIAEGVIKDNFVIHNEKKATYRSLKENNRDSIIDLTMTQNLEIFVFDKWDRIGLHGSDHHPILSNFSSKEKDISQNDTIIENPKYDFHKADWDSFERIANEKKWENLEDVDVNKHRDNIINTIFEICDTTIPKKHKSIYKGKNDKKFKDKPWWDEELTKKKNIRNDLFRKYENEKDINLKDKLLKAYKESRNKFTNLIKNKKKNYLGERIAEITENNSDTDLWNLAKSFEGKPITVNKIPPIFDKNKNLIYEDTMKAEILGTHYKNISSTSNYTKKFQSIKKNHERRNKNLFKLKENDNEIWNEEITIAELKEVINQKQDSTPGEDQISYQIFKKLPEHSLKSITLLFNNIWKTGKIPSKFKHAIISPILKPDKNPQEPASYRPISLTDHIGKLLESIVTKRLNYLLEAKGIIKETQSGFRNKRQTLDHLARLVNEAQLCRKERKQIAAVFLDLEKAYDMLWREGALHEIHKAGIKGQMFNYILDFLKDRTFQVKVGNSLSSQYTQENGTPQGSVLSPTIFNIMINKATKVINSYKYISLGQFADDTALWTRVKNAPKIGNTKKSKIKASKKISKMLEKPTNHLIDELEKNGFKVNVNKTQCIFFFSNLENNIRLNGEIVKSSTTAKYLGVIIDNKLSFKHHIKLLRDRGIKTLRILLYLSGKNWGLKSKHKLLLYKNYILPKFTYGEELFHLAPKSHLDMLNKIQNQALRNITGIRKSTKIEIVHLIAGIDPLHIRRTKKQLHMFVRFFRNKKNPARDLYKSTNVSNKSQVDNSSLTFNTIKNKKIIKLYNKDIQCIGPIAPSWKFKRPKIDVNLTNAIDKKTTDKKEMRKITENYLKEYDVYHKIYTDASKLNQKVGIGIFDEEKNRSVQKRINNNISIASGELTAIKEVTKIVQDNPEEYTKSICICTDSLSACQAIKGSKNKIARPDLVLDIRKNYTNINYQNINLEILWIPSHINIKGNDMADKLANIGREKKEVDINIKMGDSELKTFINTQVNKLIYKKELEHNNHPSVTRFLKVMPTLNTTVKLDGNHKLLNRLRSGVTTFEGPNTEIFCLKCKCRLSIKHCLKYCKLFEKERNVVKDCLYQENIAFKMKNILSTMVGNRISSKIMRLVLKINSVFEI